MSISDVKYLVGDEDFEIKPLAVYCDEVCLFLDELSKMLRNDAEARLFPDIMTFAFWCRKANILKLKSEYGSSKVRVGRGLVFHIAPSNVPINFAFSLVFGLLSGNVNIVRVSEKGFKQVDIVCRVLNQCLNKEEFRNLSQYIKIVTYPHECEINEYFSTLCSSRVIWGGDKTIEEIRKAPLVARANEMTFADRYSLAIFDEEYVASESDEELIKLAANFYNDTYLMDQNACSSPHLILWKNSDNGIGRKRFWQAVLQTAQRYDMPAKKVLDKYTLACEIASEDDIEFKLEQYDNLLYIADLNKLPEKLDAIRGKYGMFFQTSMPSMEVLVKKITTKVQTIVVHGVNSTGLREELIGLNCTGVDRIVQVGKAMDIGVFWDGYDVIGILSRVVSAE